MIAAVTRREVAVPSPGRTPFDRASLAASLAEALRAGDADRPSTAPDRPPAPGPPDPSTLHADEEPPVGPSGTDGSTGLPEHLPPAPGGSHPAGPPAVAAAEVTGAAAEVTTEVAPVAVRAWRPEDDDILPRRRTSRLHRPRRQARTTSNL